MNKYTTTMLAGVAGLSLLLPTAIYRASAERTQQETPATTTRILVLVDRSGSVHYDVKNITPRLFEDLNKLTKTGDELGLAYIHAQTVANAQRSRIAADLPSEFKGKGGSTQKRMLMEQEDEVRNQRSAMKSEVRKALAVGANPNVKQSTDVWGSLSTIQTFFRGSHPADKCIVYYISDMVESMPGKDRRDFEAKRPKDDAATLRAMARADVARIRQLYGLTGTAPLQGIDQVVVLFPTAGTERSQNNAMSRYWTEIFTQLGLPSTNLTFQ